MPAASAPTNAPTPDAVNDQLTRAIIGGRLQIALGTAVRKPPQLAGVLRIDLRSAKAELAQPWSGDAAETAKAQPSRGLRLWALSGWLVAVAVLAWPYAQPLVSTYLLPPWQALRPLLAR